MFTKKTWFTKKLSAPKKVTTQKDGANSKDPKEVLHADRKHLQVALKSTSNLKQKRPGTLGYSALFLFLDSNSY